MAAVAEQRIVKCYHCGQDCPDENLQVQQKAFCCEGCRTVYEILDENGLCSYYDIASTPGINPGTSPKPSAFEYLLDEHIQQQLLDFNNGELAKVTFSIPQIHCASCIHLLEQLYKLNPGVTHSRVDFLKREVAITFRIQEVSLAQLVALLDTIGYTPEISLGTNNVSANRSATDRTFYYRLGVAGFCFGNIMLLSLPEYFSLDPMLEGAFARYFGYLNILLALPVLLYSSQGFFSSALKGLKARSLNLDIPISLGILVLFARSSYEVLSFTGAGYMDSLAGLVFFLLIGKWFQQRTYQQLSFERDYKSYFPIAVSRIREDKEESVPLANLEVGDTILVRNEEIIPADGTILSGVAAVDYSFVTGESSPVEVNTGESVFAGGRQLGSSIQVLLTKNVSQSYLTQLWNDQAFQEEERSLSALADKVALYFTPSILIIACLAGGFWVFTEVGKAVQVFTAVLIVACPCALALSAPFTLGNAQRIMGRMGFYLKNTGVIEKLAEANALIFDKTGTLTVSAQQNIIYTGSSLTATETTLVKSLVKQSNHPLSKMVYHTLKGADDASIAFYKETPGKGIEGLVGGVYLQIGKNILGNDAATEPTNELGSTIWIHMDGEVKGRYTIKAQYRKGLQQCVAKLKEDHFLSLISGDNDKDRLRLQEYFGKETSMKFKQSPHDKLEYVKQLQAKGDKAVMLGDGLNDAGALKQSHVGIAVTDDVNNFSPACDALLNGNAFTRLPQLLGYSKTSVRLVYAAFGISLVYNFVGLGFAVQGLLSPLVAAILMPLSSVTVVVFGIVATTIAANRMGWKYMGSDKGHPSF